MGPIRGFRLATGSTACAPVVRASSHNDYTIVQVYESISRKHKATGVHPSGNESDHRGVSHYRNSQDVEPVLSHSEQNEGVEGGASDRDLRPWRCRGTLQCGWGFVDCHSSDSDASAGGCEPARFSLGHRYQVRNDRQFCLSENFTLSPVV